MPRSDNQKRALPGSPPPRLFLAAPLELDARAEPLFPEFLELGVRHAGEEGQGVGGGAAFGDLCMFRAMLLIG